MPSTDAQKRKALVNDVRKRNKKDKNPEVRNRQVTHMADYLDSMGPENVKKALAAGDRIDRKVGHTRFKKEREKQKTATAPLTSKQRDKLMADLEVAGGSYKEIDSSEETTMASKKSKLKGTAVSKDKTDAVDAAGAKAKDAVGKAKERNPVGEPKKQSKLKGSAVKDKKESKLKGSAVQGDKQGPPSPAGSADNTGSGSSTQRTPKPSSKDSAPADDDGGTPFDGDAYAKSEEGKVNREASMLKGKKKSPLRAAEDADARTKSPSGQLDRDAQQYLSQRRRAGEEGTGGKSGPAFRQNDITTEMPETRREKDEARTARIKELATSGINKDPNDKGEMPDDPKPRGKPTVLVTPNDKGEMPTPKEDKPGFMSRLRSRMGSFTSRPGAPAATATPPAPPTPPSGSGGGATPPTPPSGGGKGPEPEPIAEQTQDSKSGRQSQTAPAGGATINFAEQIGGDDTSTNRNVRVAEGGIFAGGDYAGNDINKDVSQTITGNGQPITATTSGKATNSGGRGITASTSGTATTKPAHPRAQNASRGSRPTSRKK